MTLAVTWREASSAALRWAMSLAASTKSDSTERAMMRSSEILSESRASLT